MCVYTHTHAHIFFNSYLIFHYWSRKRCGLPESETVYGILRCFWFEAVFTGIILRFTFLQRPLGLKAGGVQPIVPSLYICEGTSVIKKL